MDCCHHNPSISREDRNNIFSNARAEDSCLRAETVTLELEHDIKARCNIKGPMTIEECIEFSNVVMTDPSHGYQRHNFVVRKQDFVDAVDEVGGFVQISMDELRSSENPNDKLMHDNIISTIANFSLQIVTGISKICAERDNRNNSTDQLPPVLPLAFCSVLSRDFIFCLQKQRIRLKQKFSDDEVEKIDDQFRKLRLSVREQSGFSQMLQNAHSSTLVQSFEQCWSPLGNEYDELRRYCGAIASVMPGTSSVKADFSLINWTKDPNSQSLTDFSLESILHCKQYRKLRDLFD